MSSVFDEITEDTVYFHSPSDELARNVVYFHYGDALTSCMILDSPDSLRGWGELNPVTQARFVSPTLVTCYSDLDPHVHSSFNDKDKHCRFVQPLWAQPRGDYLLQQSRILQRSTVRFGLGIANALVDLIMDYLSCECVCLHIGSVFDCLDQQHAWAVGQIVKIAGDDDDKVMVTVHFPGWASQYDECLPFNHSVRFAPLYTYTYPTVPVRGINLLDSPDIPKSITQPIPVDFYEYFYVYRKQIAINPPVRWISAEIIALDYSGNKICCTLRILGMNGISSTTKKICGWEKIARRIAPPMTFCRELR